MPTALLLYVCLCKIETSKVTKHPVCTKKNNWSTRKKGAIRQNRLGNKRFKKLEPICCDWFSYHAMRGPSKLGSSCGTLHKNSQNTTTFRTSRTSWRISRHKQVYRKAGFVHWGCENSAPPGFEVRGFFGPQIPATIRCVAYNRGISRSTKLTLNQRMTLYSLAALMQYHCLLKILHHHMTQTTRSN